MSSDIKFKSLGTGAVIGIVGMTASGISDAICRTKLGYEQLGFINLLKVGVLTGASSSLVLFFHEKVWDSIIKKIQG